MSQDPPQLTPEQILNRPASVLELEKKDPRAAEALWQGLDRQERLRALLAAEDATQREALLTLAADTGPLVRALAPDDFARDALELGPDDAGLLIEHSSDQQLTFLLDLDGWRRDKLSPARYTQWLPLVLMAGARRLSRWLTSADPEVLALLFATWFRVVRFLPSQEQQEPPDDLPTWTLDGVHFVEFRGDHTHQLAAQILVHLKSELPELFDQIMAAMLWESAAGMSEEAARWRSGRMSDAGFPDRLEALELWARPGPNEADWRDLPPKTQTGFLAEAPLRGDQAVRLLPPSETLPAALGQLDPDARDILAAELAYIANCGAVALEADPADPEQVRQTARESLGLVNLGLALVSGGDQATAARVLERLGLAALARRGAKELRALNRRAWMLLREGWLKDLPFGLHFLDEPLDRVVAGLIYLRPRCYDPGLEGGREYRAFRSLADLEQTRRWLDKAEFWGELLFDLLDLTPEQLRAFLAGLGDDQAAGVKVSQVVGTWLAWRALGEPGLHPLPPDQLGAAVTALQAGLQGPLAAEVLESVSALADPLKASLAGDLLRGVLETLDQELGGLDAGRELDSRFLGGLVVAQ